MTFIGLSSFCVLLCEGDEGVGLVKNYAEK